MAIGVPALDADQLLERVAEQLPAELRQHVVVIGSIATAYAFRDIANTALVATKDIDLLLRPAVNAVATAEAIGTMLLAAGWKPQFPNGVAPADSRTPIDKLPALRLKPPSARETWFVELMADPPRGQRARKHWQRLTTPEGAFGLPSFRYMPIATHAPWRRHSDCALPTPQQWPSRICSNTANPTPRRSLACLICRRDS